MSWDFGPRTQTGTNGDDKIEGQTGSHSYVVSTTTTSFTETSHFDYEDEIKGKEGNDTLIGLQESDTLHGGADDDWLYGGEESIDPSSDDGYTFTEDTTKSYNRSAGKDSLIGGDGNDVLFGGAGEDTLNGGDGDDVLQGGDDTDSLIGGDGNDVIFTGELSSGNSDIIYGGNDKDTFFLGDPGTSVSPENFDVEQLATTVSEADWSDLAFTLAFPEAGLAVDLAKETAPLIIEALNESTEGEVSEPPGGKYATVKDFNPLEDIVIIPLNYDSSKGEEPNVFISQDTNTDNFLTFYYDYAGSTDAFATLNFASAGDIFPGDSILPTEFVDSVRESLLDNAMILDQSGVYKSLDSGSTIKLFGSDSDNLTEDIRTQLEDMDNPFLILGAFAPVWIEGENNSDYLYGTNFGDLIYGYTSQTTAEEASSTINFTPESAGDDQLFGYGGDDVLLGGGGADILNGGDGTDTVDYKDSNQGIGVSVDLSQNTATNDGFGTSDTFVSIEDIAGSDYADWVKGDDNDNNFVGRDGDDTLDGGAGSDTLYGGSSDEDNSDADYVDYSSASSGVSVDLEAGTASDGEGDTDTLYGIENVIGSDNDDTFAGDSNDNHFDGGDGTDTVDYSDTDGPITVTIDSDTGTITVDDGSGGVDTLSSIENIIGSSSDADALVISGNASLDSVSVEGIEDITYNVSLNDLSVTSLEDESDGNLLGDDLSLREAIESIDDGGTIRFDESLEGGTITLDSDLGQLVIDKNLTIDGSDTNITIDADGNSKVIRVDDGDYSIQSTVEIMGLTLTGGFVEFFSGSDISGKGGGIFNSENLTLNSTTISGNTAESSAGGIYNDYGAQLTIENSTISGNSAGDGGGIDFGGGSSTATISNSTISGNTAADNGGGIGQNGGSLIVNNSTITGNTAGRDGGGIFRFSGQISISSSLIAGNTASDEGNEVHSAWGGDIASGGNNLFGDSSQTEAEALTDVDLADSDITATSDGTNPTALDNILNTSLSDGVHALVTDSPAIDAGSNPDNLTTDQRGADRVVDGDKNGTATIDIGAYELQTDEISSGTVSSGPMAGSTVYFDANFNNQLDANEPSTLTDENGQYNLSISLGQFDTNDNGKLDDEEGRLLATGGTDTIAGIALSSDLSAATGSSMITPLTSIVQWLMQNGLESDDAEGQLKDILGIDESVDIHTFNPVEVLQQGTETELAETTYLNHIRVQGLLTGMTHFLSSVTGQTFAQVRDLAVGVTATGLLSLESLDTIDFSDSETFNSALTNALESLDLSTFVILTPENIDLLADTFYQTLQWVEQVLSEIEEADSLLEVSTDLKPIIYTEIPKLIDQVLAQTITWEEAQTTLDQLLGLEFVGTDVDDILMGGSGQDTVAGELGNDLIYGEAGDDVLRGDLNLRYSGEIGGNDTIFGGLGNDRIGGKAGDDLLFGGKGNDQLWGDQGNDILNGDAGNDILTGGDGNDQFVLASGNGSDIVTDFEDGQDLLLLDGLTFEQLTIEQADSATVIQFGPEILATLIGVESSLITADDFTIGS